MKRVKRRIFSGVVCEQEVYCIRDETDVSSSRPQAPRFKTEEEREKHKLEISRRRHVNAFMANFSPSSLYSTLTFDDDNEVYTAKDCRQLRDNYVRTLKRAYPDAVIFIYYGQGKTTHRFHLHMVSEGIPEEIIRAKWRYGQIVRIDHLRAHVMYDGVDHGPDYTGLANYLFNHWKPEYGGHRWKQTRNARKPDVEKAKEIRREYSEQKPPRAPKGFTLVETRSNRYGYLYFKYVKKPEKRNTRKND